MLETVSAKKKVDPLKGPHHSAEEEQAIIGGL